MASLRSFRIVCPPSLIPAVEKFLASEGFSFEPEPFSIYCRKLCEEPFPLGSSLAALFGYIYIQDRASMLPPVALGPTAGARVLDMSASPGSKTGFLAQLAGDNGLILANEPAQPRLATLRANMRRANLLQVALSGYDGAALPLFDHSWPYILLDPPCSGWGTAEKHPRTLKIWQGSKIERLVQIQRRLLAKAASLLACGGRLLYSTCTTNQAENEEQTAYAREKLGLEPVRLPYFAGFAYAESPDFAITIDGAQSASQGFYLSLLTRKNGEREYGPAWEPEATIAPESLQSPVFDAARLPPGKIGIFQNNIYFLPLHALDLPARFRFLGFHLGTLHKDKFSPGSWLRSLLPSPGQSGRQIVLEKIDDVRKILSGANFPTPLANGAAGLWWQDLPLALAQVKNGRILAPAL